MEFLRYQQFVDSVCMRLGESHVNEIYGFHGTTDVTAQSIIKTNFKYPLKP